MRVHAPNRYALAEDVSNRRAEIREQRFKGKDKSRMNKLHKLQKKADKEVQDQADFVKKAVSELNLSVFSCQGALSSQVRSGFEGRNATGGTMPKPQ